MPGLRSSFCVVLRCAATILAWSKSSLGKSIFMGNLMELPVVSKHLRRHPDLTSLVSMENCQALRSARISLCACLLMVFVLCGCSSVQSRKQEKSAVYAALSPEFREAVDQGNLKAGMPMDAVYIAWGRPNQITRSGTWDSEEIAWVYRHSKVLTTQYVGSRRTYFGYTSMSFISAEVVFRNGLVEAWKTLPDP